MYSQENRERSYDETEPEEPCPATTRSADVMLPAPWGWSITEFKGD